MWNSIVLVPDHCLSFYFAENIGKLELSSIDQGPVVQN